jgi:uncharacterized protein (TIGR02596 family)
MKSKKKDARFDLTVIRLVSNMKRVLQHSENLGSPGCHRQGFSLMELLIVIAMMGIVATMVTPVCVATLRGMQLTTGARKFSDQLKYARQQALAKNRSVEVRFYQYSDPEQGENVGPSSLAKYRAIQLFEISDDPNTSGDTYIAVGKIVQLPPSIILDQGSTLSSIIPVVALSGTLSIPRVGTKYNFSKFRFRSDGSTDLPRGSGLQFLTLHDAASGDSLVNIPPNYVTLQIDPSNGHITTHRP